MSDLISRSALLKKLESMTNDNSEYVRNNSHQFTYKELAYIICNQPTAYNVDKVVEELEEHKTQYGKLQFAHNDANMVCVYVGKEQAIDCAIDIVRKGGAE